MNKTLSKLPLMFTIIILASLAASAASVSRDIPARVSPGDTFTVTFNIAGAETGKLFTLEDDLPDSWTAASWDVTGAKEEKAAITYRAAEGNRHGWSFTANQASLQIKYTVQAPSSASGSYDFDAVWFDASGQSRDKKSITARAITCGDSICEGTENNNNCPADCPKTPEPTPTPTPTPAPSPTPTPTPAPSQGKLPVGLIIILAIAVIGVAAFFLLKKKKE